MFNAEVNRDTDCFAPQSQCGACHESGVLGAKRMKDSILSHLPKLKMLQDVVETGSFRLAASRANVTQSAISQAVVQLEKMLGRVLLVRDRGKALATQECNELLEKMNPVLRTLETLDFQIQRAVPKMSWLTFGVDESLALCVMPSLIKQLKEKCPGTKLTMRTGSAAKLISMVRKGELCMAVVREHDNLENLSVMPVSEDKLGVYFSEAHFGNNANSVTLKDIGVAALSAPEGGHPLYFTKFVKTHLPAETPNFTCDSYESLRGLALSGCFAAILPERLANHSPERLVSFPNLSFEKNNSHKILLVSRNDCDYEENLFLLNELKSFL